MTNKVAEVNKQTEFSLVQGGPLFDLLLRAGLLRLPIDLAPRRMVVLSLVAWLPLLLLSGVSGQTVSGVSVPFLFDLGAHARLLVCIPLLIAAEAIAHRRIKATVQQFLDRDLVPPEERSQFNNLIFSSMQLRNSGLAELVLLAFAVFAGYWIGQRYLAMRVASWHTALVDGETHLSPAGYWYLCVSMTLFRFLLVRWYFRLFVWYRFLWQISRRVRLRLNPLHPDRAGGLGFLASSAFALTPVLLAHSVALSGVLATQIWHEGARLPDFKLEIAAWIAFLLLVVVCPLFFFVSQLADAKHMGLLEYGRLASHYVADFRRKWIDSSTENAESLVGTADIQSLADLSNSYEVVRTMRMSPLDHVMLMHIATLLVLPLLPLVLTMVPLEQLLDRAVGLFFSL